MDRRSFLKATFVATASGAVSNAQTRPPNIVFILADDIGYGDLGCYGSDIQTPNLDGMASEGVRFDHFCSASPVCSPSRAALMTGRYPTRMGISRVLAAADIGGLSLTETMLPQLLKTQNYATMCVGKWHLGSTPGYLPTNRGFDQFYGLPYSNDMTPLPLMRNTDVIEQPAVQNTLTRRYTSEAVNFIQNSKDSPFFLYFAHTAPHIPLPVSDAFKGRSGMGLYADCVQEIDWSVGQILSALKANNIDGNTLVIFTSDHGPWYQGSAGRLRGRKGETYEGGVRVPFIARFPGRIPSNRTTPMGADGRVSSGRTSRALITMLDVVPTLARLAGAALPAQPLDGVDIWPLLSGEQNTVDHPPFFYFDDWNLQCARVGHWKVHFSRYNSTAWGPDPVGGRINLPLPQPELYNLASDPQESYDISENHPDVVADILQKTQNALPTFPAIVQNVWQATMSMKVEGTPDGALPVKTR